MSDRMKMENAPMKTELLQLKAGQKHATVHVQGAPGHLASGKVKVVRVDQHTATLRYVDAGVDRCLVVRVDAIVAIEGEAATFDVPRTRGVDPVAARSAGVYARCRACACTDGGGGCVRTWHETC